MVLGLFKERTVLRARSARAAEELQQLLNSATPRRCRFLRNHEIGPFVVDYVCCESALIVELAAPGRRKELHAARHALLTGMGYEVLQVSQDDLRLRPGQVRERIRAALRRPAEHRPGSRSS